MKSKLTFLFIFIFLGSIAQAQYDSYPNGTMLGAGIGYNLISIVGDDVRPIDVSFRCRFNNVHSLQLFLPFWKQKDAYKSKGFPEMELMKTSLDSKKRLFGVGIDYDYALRSFSSLDFVIGLRAEYQYYKYETNLTNRYPPGNDLSGAEITFSSKKTNNYIISPNAGMRLNFNRFSVDAKFLLSMLSRNGDVNNRITVKEPTSSSKVSITKEWTDDITNKFKLKPAVLISMAYFF